MKKNDKNEHVGTFVKDERKRSWSEIRIPMFFLSWATMLISYVVILFFLSLHYSTVIHFVVNTAENIVKSGVLTQNISMKALSNWWGLKIINLF